jgi:L-fucose mutarotase
MLRQQLVHPKMLEVLGRAGHHARILIADGHYPVSTRKGPNAELVSLNLMPGVVTCTQVLQAVLSAMPIDEVSTMMYEASVVPAAGREPPVWDEFRSVLRAAGLALELKPIEKWDFYRAVETPDHVLTVQTADMETYANLLLSVGVRRD